MKPLAAGDPAVVASYKLVGVLGGGGMGRVYLGESRTGRRVAIKVVHEEFASDPVFRRRFAREVKVARKVSPLYTAAVVDADPDAEVPWLATTYIAGPTLTQLVIESGPLSPKAVLILAAGLSDALASIHRVGLVHRDLKPSNVIIDDAGPHIIDFGIALTSETTRITTSVVVGTPSYIAPEIIYGDESSPASDVFSLGATLVFAASGRHLVEDGTMYTQIMQISRGAFDLAAVPGELRPLVVRCVSVEPRDRPTAEELATILVASGVPLPSPGWYTTKDPAPGMDIAAALSRRRYSRRRVLAVGGLVGAAVVSTGAGVGLGLFRRADSGSTARWAGPSGAPLTSPAVGAPTGAGRVIWQARSGVEARPVTNGDQPSVTRVVPDSRGHIIVADGAQVIAVNAKGDRIWTKPLTGSTPLTLRNWGGAVLVSDPRRMWLLDAGTGSELFNQDVVGEEEKLARFDNPDNRAVEIGAVALSPGRAYVSLGTATIALSRGGEKVWRLARPPAVGGRRPPAEAPRYGTDAWLVTHDVSDQVVQVTLRNAASKAFKWSVTYDPGPKSSPGGGGGPPPPGGTGPSQGPGGGPPGDGPPGNDERWHWSEARITANQVVLRDYRSFRVVGLADGKLVWSRPPEMPITAIEVVGDLLLVAADRLTAYAVATGQQRWQREYRGARLAIGSGGRTVVAATEDGVFGLDLTANGSVLWHTALPAEVAPDCLITDGQAAYLSFNAEGRPERALGVDLLAIALS